VKILLLEDDLEVRELIATCLKMWGHEVTLADNGLEAWELTMGLQLDLLIADWGVPGLVGVDLVRNLRLTEPGRNLPVLMISGRAERDQIDEARQAGVDGYLRKPFTPSQLRKKVEALHKTEEQQAFLARIERTLGQQQLQGSETSPLLLLGEAVSAPKILAAPEHRERAQYLIRVAEAVTHLNTRCRGLGLNFFIHYSTHELTMLLRRTALSRRVRVVLVSADCPGFGMLALRAIAKRGEGLYSTYMVASDGALPETEQQEELEGLGIGLLRREQLGQLALRALLAEKATYTPMPPLSFLTWTTG
jgi:two-component system chemotaxis response regulator CheY